MESTPILEYYVTETVKYDETLADINLQKNDFSGSEKDGRGEHK